MNMAGTNSSTCVALQQPPQLSALSSRRLILSLLLILGTVPFSSAFFGRRRYRPHRYSPTPEHLRHPSFREYRRKVYADAAQSFVPNQSDEDDENHEIERNFYGQSAPRANSGRGNASDLASNQRQEYERSVMEKAGIRPYKLQSPPKYGRSSLSSKLVMTNVLCYALQVWKPQLTRWGAKRSELILSGKELYRLITPVFLHGSLPHLLINSYSLNNIGPEIEKTFGSGRFLATYIVSGIAGNMLSAIASPNPAVGASGAIFGLMGAHFVFLNNNERFMGSYGKRGMAAVTETVGTNFLFGLFVPMIDNWGHAGGFVGGAAMAATFGPKLLVLGYPDGRRVLVDKPMLRVPLQYEAIASKVRQKFTAKLLPGHLRFQSDFEASPLVKPSSSRALPRTTTPSRDLLKPRARWQSPVPPA